ncbi:MAG: hypothetical protein UHK60_10715 [Acutalibacteraceae bacterium]|nr:hypothetical protein [Acutalibacteraceae bacterium]
MKRIHWFEIMDFDWFPSFFRDIITDTIKISDKNPIFNRIVPVIIKAMEKSKTNTVVDLCSGGGGPWFQLFHLIKKEKPDFELKFTDLFPNKKTIDSIPPELRENIEYILEPIDATNVPKDLKGIRTFFGSFHHMRPEQAKQILEGVAKDKVGIVAGEVCMFPRDKAWLLLVFELLFFPFYLLMYWIMAIKAIKGTILTKILRFIFIYPIPVIPLVMMWDSAVSAMRVYTKDDLENIIKDIKVDGYVLEAKEIPPSRNQPAIHYCIGYPVDDNEG